MQEEEGARRLNATSVHEGPDTSWSGKTWKGIIDGKLVASGRDADLTRADISASYTLNIPGPGPAVARFKNPLPNGEPSGGGNSNDSLAGSNGSGNSATSGSNNGSALLVSVPTVVALVAIFVNALALK